MSDADDDNTNERAVEAGAAPLSGSHGSHGEDDNDQQVPDATISKSDPQGDGSATPDEYDVSASHDDAEKDGDNPEPEAVRDANSAESDVDNGNKSDIAVPTVAQHDDDKSTGAQDGNAVDGDRNHSEEAYVSSQTDSARAEETLEQVPETGEQAKDVEGEVQPPITESEASQPQLKPSPRTTSDSSPRLASEDQEETPVASDQEGEEDEGVSQGDDKVQSEQEQQPQGLAVDSSATASNNDQAMDTPASISSTAIEATTNDDDNESLQSNKRSSSITPTVAEKELTAPVGTLATGPGDEALPSDPAPTANPRASDNNATRDRDTPTRNVESSKQSTESDFNLRKQHNSSTLHDTRESGSNINIKPSLVDASVEVDVDAEAEAEEERVRIRKERIKRQRHEQLRQIAVEERERQERQMQVEAAESHRLARRARLMTNQTTLQLLRAVPIDTLDEWLLTRQHRSARIIQAQWRQRMLDQNKRGEAVRSSGNAPAVSMPPPDNGESTRRSRVDPGSAFMLNTPEIEYEDIAKTYDELKTRAQLRVFGGAQTGAGDGTMRSAHESYQELLRMRGQVEMKLGEYVQCRDQFRDDARSIQNSIHSCTRMSAHLRRPKRLEEYERDLERMAGVASKFGEWLDAFDDIADLHPDGKTIMPRREFVDLVRAQFRAAQSATQHAEESSAKADTNADTNADANPATVQVERTCQFLPGVCESDLMVMLDHVLPSDPSSILYAGDDDLFGDNEGLDDGEMIDVTLLKARDWTTLAPPSTSSLHSRMPERVKRAHRERLTNANATAHGKWWRVVEENKQRDIRDWALGTDPSQVDKETDRLGSNVWIKFCGGMPSDYDTAEYRDMEIQSAGGTNIANAFPNDELIARNAAQVVSRMEQLLAIHGEQATRIQVDDVVHEDQENESRAENNNHQDNVWNPLTDSAIPNAIGSDTHVLKVETGSRAERQESNQEHHASRRTRPSSSSRAKEFRSDEARSPTTGEEGGSRSERDEERTRRRQRRKERRRSRSSSASGRLAKQLMEKMDLLTTRLHTLESNTTKQTPGLFPPLPPS